jgi:hypothetical protein
MQTFTGVASGTFVAPDHEYPSSLLLRLTATDVQGLGTTRELELDPRTVVLTLESFPPGLTLGLNSESASTPLTNRVIEGSLNSVGAESPQVLGSQVYRFSSWSDGGAGAHTITANASAILTATFTPDAAALVPSPANDALELRKLKLRIPKSIERLIERGGRAKLSCNLDCVATVRLVAHGRDAKRARIDGTIAREVARLTAETPTWVVAELRRRVVRKLERAKAGLRPRVTPKIQASAD